MGVNSDVQSVSAWSEFGLLGANSDMARPNA